MKVYCGLRIESAYNFKSVYKIIARLSLINKPLDSPRTRPILFSSRKPAGTYNSANG